MCVPGGDCALDVWFWSETLTDDMYTTHFPKQHTRLIAVKQEQGTTDSRQAGEQTERQIQLQARSHIAHSQHMKRTNTNIWHQKKEERSTVTHWQATLGVKKKKKKEQDCEMVNLD